VSNDALRHARLGGALLLASSCSNLYGGDSPRASLRIGDTFEIDPRCVDLPIDGAALVRPERFVTLTARRGNTDLGAEGVPVSARLGMCEGMSIDAGASMDGGGNGVTDSRIGQPQQPRFEGNTCGGPTGFGDLEIADFELVSLEGRGCRRRSSARLDCTLDASGEATFAVTAFVGAGVILDGVVPICITPNELPARHGSKSDIDAFQEVIFVKPRSATSRVALAIARVDTVESAEPIADGTDCSELRDCREIRSRARLQMGFAPIDVPRESVRSSDFRTVQSAFNLSAQVQVLSGISELTAYLSQDPNCALPDSGVPDVALNLELPIGHRSTGVFHVCSDGSATRVEITPDVVDGNSGSVEIVPAVVGVDALLSGYRAEEVGNAWTLFERKCGQADTVALAGASLDPNCSPLPGFFDAGSADANVIDAEAARSASQCGPIILPLQTGGTCSLVVGR
jgi:hypothetical protein